MTTDTATKPGLASHQAEQDVIAPASLLARIMLLGAGIGMVTVFFNAVFIVISGQPRYLITLFTCLACVVACIVAWRLAIQNRSSTAALLLVVITSIAAVVGVWMNYGVLPLSLTLITCGVLLTLPYVPPHAFRRIILFSMIVFLLVGALYIFNEPAATTFLFFVRVSIFLSCLLIVVLMSYLVYRSSNWMHAVVRDVREANMALRETQAGLEETVQSRTAELTLSNQHLTLEIAERRRIEEQLRNQNAFLETLHDTSLGIVRRLEMKELLQSILHQAADMLHVEDAFLDLIAADGKITMSYAALGLFDVAQTYDFVKGEGLVGTVWESGKTVVVDDYACWERRSPHVVAGEIHAAVGAPLMLDGRVYGVIGMVRQTPGHRFTQDEVSLLERLSSLASVACDNAQLYEAVRANEQALEQRVEIRTRELTAALAENDVLRAKAVIAAMAAERSRLARDLHDSVSQAIYGIVLGTRTLQQLISNREPADAQLNKVVDYILNLADAALTEMRALIFELRPESLEREGILAAISKHCDVLHFRHGLKIILHLMDEEPALPIEVKEGIYRIAVEAMHNVVKHAGATQITVRFQPVDGHIELEIIDDGIGFDVDAAKPGQLGLSTMQERAAEFHGKLVLKSERCKGTAVCVEIPLPTAIASRSS